MRLNLPNRGVRRPAVRRPPDYLFALHLGVSHPVAFSNDRGTEFIMSYDSSRRACEAACKRAPGCVAFDFTTMISGQSTCRGAPAGQQPRSGDGGRHHRKYCTIPSPTQPGPTTFCEVGQTQGGGPWVFESSDNSKSACEAACKLAPGCVAFDFTTMISGQSTCRGAPAGQQPRSGDGGRHHRQYCTILAPTQT
mmetsp:Transcript_91045/g.283664  ORF Transcript_91045/g.283664 Transcript_91045/m.283664 type:complete len:194 (-) Transcript_91045:166-747(-)